MHSRRGLPVAGFLVLAGLLYVLWPFGEPAIGVAPADAGSRERSTAESAEPRSVPVADGPRVALDDRNARSVVPPRPRPVTVRGRCVRAVGGEPLAGCVAEARRARAAANAAAACELSFEVALRRVRVSVLDATGAPLADRRVKLTETGVFLPGGLRTDGDGFVEIFPAPFDAFHLQVDVDGAPVRVGPIDLPPGVRTGDVAVRVGG